MNGQKLLDALRERLESAEVEFRKLYDDKARGAGPKLRKILQMVISDARNVISDSRDVNKSLDDERKAARAAKAASKATAATGEQKAG